MTIKKLILLLLFFFPISLQAQLVSSDLFYKGSNTQKVLLGKVGSDSAGYIRFGESEFTTSDDITIGSHPFARVETFNGLPDLFNLVFTDKLYADTIFINLLSLPNSPLSNFNQLTSSLQNQFFVPAYIQSVAFQSETILRERRFRIPFPDSLIPKNPLVSYPDSADISINVTYKQGASLTIQDNKGSNGQLLLGLDLIIKVKPIIGNSFDFTIPLLDKFQISLSYLETGIGFGFFKSEEYEVSIPFSLIGGEDSTLFSIPAISLELANLPTAIEENELSPKPHLIEIFNYPNPFNPVTSLSFNIPRPAILSIDVVNSLGQVVLQPIRNTYYENGQYSILLNFSNLGNGIYFARLYGLFVDKNESIIDYTTMILIK